MNDALGQPQSVLVLGGGSEIARALLRRLVGARDLGAAPEDEDGLRLTQRVDHR